MMCECNDSVQVEAYPTAKTVKSTEWLCVSLSKNILEREKIVQV